MKCPKCKKDVDKLTRDHIIPKWFFNPERQKNLGLRDKKQKWGNLIKEKYTEMICSDCNIKKGGIMDFSHPIVREFIEDTIKKWNELLLQANK